MLTSSTVHLISSHLPKKRGNIYDDIPMAVTNSFLIPKLTWQCSISIVNDSECPSITSLQLKANYRGLINGTTFNMFDFYIVQLGFSPCPGFLFIFLVGDPNLNLHLPLTSWEGGQPQCSTQCPMELAGVTARGKAFHYKGSLLCGSQG